MSLFDVFRDDAAIDLVRSNSAAETSPLVVKAVKRGRAGHAIAFQCAPDLLDAIGRPTRCRVRYDRERLLFLIVADDLTGRFEFRAYPKSQRQGLTIPVPDGLVWCQGGAETDPGYEVDAVGRRLVVSVPAFLRPPAPAPARSAVDAARAAVPAPQFGTRKG